MRVWDIAVLNRAAVKRGEILHCGSGTYSHAIVASVSPFILVSCDGSMMWRATVKPADFNSVGRASEQEIEAVRNRMAREKGGAT